MPGSRRHSDPSSLLLPDQQWQAARDSFAEAVELPIDGAQRLRVLAGEQAELIERLARERDASSEAQLTDDGLLVDDAAVDAVGEGRLRKLIEPRLPEVDLPELLIEVDGWTRSTDHLTPLSGNRRRSADMPSLLYAVIVAQATNLELSGMARASDYSYQQLEWAWEQLCREDTLTAASASLVDYHHGLPLAHDWGAGRLSSSDGQRFATRTRGPGVAALPRYFGHRRRGLQIYSWTSDQYSQYASKVIAATVRDATHTLDGILDNQTVLPIEEHTTDTHGYTEMIFGAYDLLGLRFAPRIRDLDRQQLYRHGIPPAVEAAELLKRKIRPKLIVPYWDELLRLAASLRHGWAPASLLLARLQAGSRRNPLAQALQEYGRLVKTNFVLDWLADEELRQRIGRQLNKGEQLHALRRAIFYANERPRPAAHPRAAGRAGALPGDRRQRDHRLEHRLHRPRPRRAPSQRGAHHHQRDRAHLPAGAPAHPPLRPLPLRARQPTRGPPTSQNADRSVRTRAHDAEPRLTLSVKIRAVTNEGPDDATVAGGR
jgi:TnpA family transposase